ncbi:hypothetical protein [Mycolicibacterium houstonense]|uniref:hypothetical protein n=1 Tax=Mycolicibacterium houstonense TaxID=146021 RepID=UPI003F96E988
MLLRIVVLRTAVAIVAAVFPVGLFAVLARAAQPKRRDNPDRARHRGSHHD